MRIAAEIADHDLQAHVINEDGERFLTDEDFALEGELVRAGNDANAHGVLNSGRHWVARQRAVVDASRRVRNEVSRCDQIRRRIAVSERWWHRLWRMLSRNRFPAFTYRAQAIEQLETRRAVEVRFAGGGPVAWSKNDLLD